MLRVFTRTELLERASVRVAVHMRQLLEERGSSDTRLLEALFLPDNLTLAGHSRSFTGKGRREHVIPRKVIIDECHRMLKEHQPDEAVAKFIREHVKIVMISNDECERLDRVSALGLRQKMPKGWKFGDSPYARLEAAGIEWIPTDMTDLHGDELSLAD